MHSSQKFWITRGLDLWSNIWFSLAAIDPVIVFKRNGASCFYKQLAAMTDRGSRGDDSSGEDTHPCPSYANCTQLRSATFKTLTINGLECYSPVVLNA